MEYLTVVNKKGFDNMPMIKRKYGDGTNQGNIMNHIGMNPVGGLWKMRPDQNALVYGGGDSNPSRAAKIAKKELEPVFWHDMHPKYFEDRPTPKTIMMMIGFIL